MLPKPEDYNRYSSDEKSEMLATSDTFFESYICAWYYRRRYDLSDEETLVLFAIVQIQITDSK